MSSFPCVALKVEEVQPHQTNALRILLTAALAFVATAAPATAYSDFSAANLAVGLVLCAALTALTTIDILTFRLPDALTLPLLAAGCLLSYYELPTFYDRVCGAVVGYLLLWAVSVGYRLVRGQAGLGLGDAKLLGAAGAWTGWDQIPAILLLASVLGLAFALLAQVSGARLTRQTRLAFGPFLALAFWLDWQYVAWLN